MLEMQNIDELIEWLLDDNQRGEWKCEINGRVVEKVRFESEGVKTECVRVRGSLIELPKDKSKEVYLSLAECLYISLLLNLEGDDDE